LSTLAVSLPVKVFTFITSPSYESLVTIPFNRPPLTVIAGMPSKRIALHGCRSVDPFDGFD
jgi:hypothetical protein